MVEVNPKVSELYIKYLKKLPLDLKEENRNSIDIAGWKSNVQLSILDFCRILKVLLDNNNLRNITRSGIDLDFDNIEPIISVLIEENMMKFVKPNIYKIEGLKKSSIISTHFNFSKIINPDEKFNQFPCSKESVLKRVKALVEDFPFVRSMNVGLFGDDDLVSIEIARRTNFKPIVFEIDEKIIKKIKTVSERENLNIKIIQKDFRGINLSKYKLDTFITDPPYTVGGILSFLYHGLKSLNTRDRFYLIANQMFLGYKGMPEVFETLVKSGIYPIKICPAYNEYPLPKNYRELGDIRKKFEDKINPNKIFSSSSSLFVFKVSKEIKYEILLKKINNEMDIYDRYRRFSND